MYAVSPTQIAARTASTIRIVGDIAPPSTESCGVGVGVEAVVGVTLGVGVPASEPTSKPCFCKCRSPNIRCLFVEQIEPGLPELIPQVSRYTRTQRCRLGTLVLPCGDRLPPIAPSPRQTFRHFSDFVRIHDDFERAARGLEPDRRHIRLEQIERLVVQIKINLAGGGLCPDQNSSPVLCDPVLNRLSRDEDRLVLPVSFRRSQI